MMVTWWLVAFLPSDMYFDHARLCFSHAQSDMHELVCSLTHFKATGISSLTIITYLA